MRKITRRLRRVLARPLSALPPGNLKNRARAWMMHYDHNIPLFFAVDPGNNVIKVGNPHMMTVHEISRRIGPSGQCVIVEADPDNARQLHDKLGELPHKNVRIIPRGAWSSSGQLLLSRSPHPEDHKIEADGIIHDNDFRPENTYDDKVAIPVDTIDNIMAEAGLDRVDLLDVKVNGAELEVLKGSEQALKSPNIRVFAKAHARYEDGTPINRDIRQFLDDRGLQAIITRGEPAVGTNPNWTMRDGDVFGYRRR